MPMEAAIVAMTARRFGCLGVQDAEGRLVGIITDGDLRRALEAWGGEGLMRRTVGEVMTRSPRTIGPDALAVEALREMNARAITALFVVDGDGRPIGILHIHDLLRAGVA
jgi:arabinose-5-phosphate isomerase